VTRRQTVVAGPLGLGLLLGCFAWFGHARADEMHVVSNALPPLALESEPAGGLTRAEIMQRVKALTAVGQRMFFDTSLSGSGKLSCASCHSPAFAYGPPNDFAVQLGGKDGLQSGVRAVPGLKYLQTTPGFTPHYYESEDDGDESIDNGPTGGLTWDGRANQVRDQVRIPLLSNYEMANASAGDVVKKARAAGYVAELQEIMHDDRLASNDALAFDAITFAFEVQQEDQPNFFPYSSKFDAMLRRQATLTEQEAHGFDLFNDPSKGNCASCHVSKVSGVGTSPVFTDFGLIALGLPRNAAVPANADPNYFDLGLCGPYRTDYQDNPDYCGLFKTPSLRNVALRKTFMHNGLIHDLRQAVVFYVERDTKPEKWYPSAADGTVAKYDDLPAAYRANVNDDPPFGPQPDNKPLLSDSEIDDIVAFLRTLTDGYVPKP
jgi:cytochrome c peroxidase